MKILNSSDFCLDRYRLKSILSQSIYYNLLLLLKDKSLGLTQMLDRYSLYEIKNALRDIKIDDKGIIYIPERTKSDYIIRYLEFGGDGVRPTHLISSVTNNLIKHYSKGDI
jgi:hypothetical protein